MKTDKNILNVGTVLTNEVAQHAGEMLIKVLGLTVNPYGKVQTAWGLKNPTGVARVALAVLEESYDELKNL